LAHVATMGPTSNAISHLASMATPSFLATAILACIKGVSLHGRSRQDSMYYVALEGFFLAIPLERKDGNNQQYMSFRVAYPLNLKL
jgi:hypothetical protein